MPIPPRGRLVVQPALLHPQLWGWLTHTPLNQSQYYWAEVEGQLSQLLQVVRGGWAGALGVLITPAPMTPHSREVVGQHSCPRDWLTSSCVGSVKGPLSQQNKASPPECYR